MRELYAERPDAGLEGWGIFSLTLEPMGGWGMPGARDPSPLFRCANAVPKRLHRLKRIETSGTGRVENKGNATGCDSLRC
jgi:hypothetical protein